MECLCYEVYSILARNGWAAFKVDTMRLKDGRIATRFLVAKHPQNLGGIIPTNPADLKTAILTRLGAYAFISEVQYRHAPEIRHMAIYVTAK